MIEWLHERYISRDEHQQVVDYYTKLVAQLYREVCALRAAQVDAQALDSMIELSRRKAEREIRRTKEPAPSRHGDNVIRVDFRRRW